MYKLARAPELVLWLLLLSSNLPAFGASVETLVMPGPLTAAHADLESNCGHCHARFDQGAQDNLCIACHETIQADISKSSGFHGINPVAKQGTCSQCHTDHQGRNKNIDGLIAELFDHNYTDFPLQGSHQETACTACHTDKNAYREAQNQCEGCHSQDSPHEQSISQCKMCHNAENWRVMIFDHNQQTEFNLVGAHTRVTCKTCHTGASFNQAASECSSCHALDDVHQGSRGNDCGTCHDSDQWSNATFNHKIETDFALLGRHAELVCNACHMDAQTLVSPPTACIGCHSSDDTHQGRNGDECDSCHNNSQWTVKFDHFGRSGFALQGAHQRLSCTACHSQSIEAPIESACYSCHVDKDPHGGDLPACADCHGETSWLTELRFHHDLTSFPLLGSHKLSSCEQCHATLQFSHPQGEQCIDCHQQEDKHNRSLGEQCSNCHTPIAWALWQFDHNDATGYVLDGAHQGLECAACHNANNTPVRSSSCQSCHRSDDPHHGGFGADCQRCHTSDTFSSVKIGRSP